MRGGAGYYNKRTIQLVGLRIFSSTIEIGFKELAS